MPDGSLPDGSMPPGDPAYLAIDWGTTNRRVYRIAADGAVLGRESDHGGVLALGAADYPREIAAIRSRLGALPIIAAGMVGSTLGWRDAGYVAAPVDLAGLAAAMVMVAGEDVRIVPGVRTPAGGRADVMRGEEVQLLGAVAAGLAPPSGLFCHPGTHSKWATLSAARITGFTSAMTGELFALLRDHGSLAPMMAGPVGVDGAFDQGLAAAQGGADLLSALFGVRASVVLGDRPAAEAAAHVSGILIGSDVVARRLVAGTSVQLIAAAPLVALYTRAIGQVGGRAVAIDSEAAFVAGIHALWETTT